MHVLLIAVWCTSVIAAGVAILAWTPRGAARWLKRALLLALVGVPLALEIWIAGTQGWAGIALGGGARPFLLAALCVVVHAAGIVLAARALRAGWRPVLGAWGATALVGSGVSALVLGLLVARAELHASRLQAEADRLAHELLPPPPRPEDDAWPKYVEFESRIAQVVDLDAWIADVEAVEAGADLDLEDEARRERFERVAPLLAEARRASELPDCDFSRRRAHGRHDFFSAQHALVPAGTLRQAWLLEGAYAVATGRLDLALEDYAALLRLSEQAAASPLMIDLHVGLSLRVAALELLERILPAADEADLAHLSTLRPTPLASHAGRALDMELAWFLSSMGMVWSRDPRLDGLPWTPSRWGESLYLAFRFESDMRGYREVMADCRVLAEGSLEALRGAHERGDIERASRSRGPMASYLVSNVASSLWFLRRTDERFDLAAAATDAFLQDRGQALAVGAWTADERAWGDDPPTFELR